MDGLVPKLFRNFTNSKETGEQWLVFDGPMDVNWVENLNTVLDEHKCLCLCV